MSINIRNTPTSVGVTKAATYNLVDADDVSHPAHDNKASISNNYDNDNTSNGQGNGSDFDGHMVISMGYEAAGQAALLKTQAIDVDLQRLYRQQLLSFLKDQKANMDSTAEAVMESAKADARNDFADMGDHITQAAMGAANVGASAYQQSKLQDNLAKSKTDQADAETLQRQFNDASDGNNAISDEDAKTMENDPRYKELKDGGTDLKPGSDDEDRLSHIKGKPEDRKEFTKNINQKRSDAINEQHTATNQAQAYIQMCNTVFTILQQSGSAIFSSRKAYIAEHQKGPAEAVKSYTQTKQQIIETAVQQFMGSASTLDQNAAQINQAREKLAEGQKH